MRKSQYKSRLAVWMPFGLWRIDWYYIRFYLKVFFIILIGLFALVSIGDLFQRFDDFILVSRRDDLDLAATVAMFLKFYASYVPQMVFQYMLPVIMLMAASITVTASYSGPRGNNEYIVVRSAGIPVLRAFFPLLFPALAIAVVFQATRDYYLPHMVREYSVINNHMKSRRGVPVSVSLIGPEGYQVAAIGWFAPDSVAHNMIVEVRDADKFHQGRSAAGDNDFVAYRAASARLERRPDGGYQWTPTANGKVQTFTRFARSETDWTRPLATSMTPAMIERQIQGDAVSSWRDLLLLRNDNAGAKFELYWRLADPIACCLLILWGTGLSMGLMLRGRSSGFIFSVAVSTGAAIVFYVFRVAGQTMWESGVLTTEQGVWFPIAASALIALPIVFWMEK